LKPASVCQTVNEPFHFRLFGEKKEKLQITNAPCLKTSSANALPNPTAPPVMITTLSLRNISAKRQMNLRKQQFDFHS